MFSFPNSFSKNVFQRLSTLLRGVDVSMDCSQKAILHSEVLFYQKLTASQKVRFEKRVLSFINSKDFFGMHGLEVTKRMKLLIAATATMLTFGFPYHNYSSFNNILIYPDDYYSFITKTYHKGETNPKFKTVVFSWKAFEEDIKIIDNNRNLGIHEFVHALHFNFLQRYHITATIFLCQYEKLLEILKDTNKQKALKNKQYIRNYAFKNQYEFLSVIMEHFFETPELFKRFHPELYSKIKQMFNINVQGY